MPIDTYTESQVNLIKLARELAKKLGKKSLSPSDFRANSNVTEYTIAREFGGWVELFKCAELEIPNRYAEVSDDELLGEMDRVFQAAGKRVNSTRFDALSKFSSKMYRTRFGSWTEALSRLEALGTNESHQSVVDNNEILTVAETLSASGKPSITIAADVARSILRTAIDLLKSHPESFQAELAEIQTLALEFEQTAVCLDSPCSPQRHTQRPVRHASVSSLIEIVRWLAQSESVSISDFRGRLIPLDILPNAAIDAINEVALEVCGEIAIEEDSDVIVVEHKAISQVCRTFGIGSIQPPLHPLMDLRPINTKWK